MSKTLYIFRNADNSVRCVVSSLPKDEVYKQYIKNLHNSFINSDSNDYILVDDIIFYKLEKL